HGADATGPALVRHRTGGTARARGRGAADGWRGLPAAGARPPPGRGIEPRRDRRCPRHARGGRASDRRAGDAPAPEGRGRSARAALHPDHPAPWLRAEAGAVTGQEGRARGTSPAPPPFLGCWGLTAMGGARVTKEGGGFGGSSLPPTFSA